jgi:hypothetical protein
MGNRKANTRPPPGEVPDWKKTPGLVEFKPKGERTFERDSYQIHGPNWGCPDDTSDDGESDNDSDPRKPTANVLKSIMPV